jgi:hypothetical protein
VRYAPAGPAPAPPTWPPDSGPAPGTFQPRGQDTRRSPAGPLLVLASIAVAVGIAVVFPVAGLLIALIALMALRAGDRTVERLTRRRSRRGARAGDAVLAAALFPPSFAWSVLRSVLLLPLGLIAAGIAAAVTIVAVPHHPIPLACAYGAGMLVLFYGFGPGSGGARRPIRSLFDLVADTPVRATAAFIMLAVVVVAEFVVVASHPPFFWPAEHLTGWLGHFNVVHTVVHDLRDKVLRLFGRPSS